MVTLQTVNGVEYKVSDEDAAWVSQFRWYSYIPKKTSRGTTTYITRPGHLPGTTGEHNRVTVYLHRSLLAPDKGEQVDHINGDTCDNRRENLRLASAAQQAMNRPPPSTNTSGFKGVSRANNNTRPWQAAIRKAGKTYYLGQFATAVEAAKAYDRAALERFGEFAWLNFPNT